MGLGKRANENTKFLILPTNKAGPSEVVCGEKMSRFLTLYKVKTFSEAIDLAIKIQEYQGAGHSLGFIHRMKTEHMRSLCRLKLVGSL